MFEGAVDPGVIVVGVDGSEASWRAAAYAAGMARRQRSRLAVVYVRPTHALAATVGLSPGGLEAGLLAAQEIERQIREGAERAGPAAPRWEFRTVSGDVCAGLSQVARELHADAVVVGACRGLGHRLVGSPTLRLARARRWPVIIVP